MNDSRNLDIAGKESISDGPAETIMMFLFSNRSPISATDFI